MASEGLKSEVSTDILLVENKENGTSGVRFVENVVEFCKEQNINIPMLYTVCEILQKKFSGIAAKSEYTDGVLLASITKMKEEIKVLEMLIKKRDEEEETKNLFNIAPLMFVEATIPPQNLCYVKLSNTVTVEMTLDEALKYSKDKLERLIKNEESMKKQLKYLKDQNTILQLNMNRCFAYIQADMAKEKAASK